MVERRGLRLGLKVIHRHRVGDRAPFARVSDLVFVDGRPRVVLNWINIGGGVRTPLYQLDLDPSHLRRRAGRARHVYYYDGVTSDPRYLDEEGKAERGMRFELMPRSG